MLLEEESKMGALTFYTSMKIHAIFSQLVVATIMDKHSQLQDLGNNSINPVIFVCLFLRGNALLTVSRRAPNLKLGQSPYKSPIQLNIMADVSVINF